FVAARVHEDIGALPRDPLNDVVCRNLGKEESTVAGPDGAFRPLVEAIGNALQLGVRRNQAIERGIELLNFLRKEWDGDRQGNQGQQQKKEETMVCHGRGIVLQSGLAESLTWSQKCPGVVAVRCEIMGR